MKCYLGALAVVVALAPVPRAGAALIDTLTGLTPGDLIGCDYTFQNGDPSIPCAKDTVAPDGTASFVKPNAPYDNIEYYDVTTGKDILEIITPPSTPVQDHLTPQTEYPLLQPFHADSFFDVFFELQLPEFNDDGLNGLGTFTIGQTFEFVNGTSTGLPDTLIPGFTGTVEVVGFDQVSASPEPSALVLLAAGLGGLLWWRRVTGSPLSPAKR